MESTTHMNEFGNRARISRLMTWIGVAFLVWARVMPTLAQNEYEALTSLRVVEETDGKIFVEWIREPGPAPILGWHVERQLAGGDVVRVTPERVEAELFDPPGRLYRIQDAGVAARVGDLVSYRLVTVDPELVEWPAPFLSYVVESRAAEPEPAGSKVPRTPTAPAPRVVAPASSGDRLRIVVANDGLQRLTAGQIAAALEGYDEARVAQAIAQNNLALSCGGKAVAWRAEAGGAALLFFGQSYRDPYVDRNVYFLEPGPGLAMASANRTTASVASDPWFWEVARVEQDVYFMPSMPGGVQDDYFFWDGKQVTSPAVSWQWTTNVELVDPHPDMKQGTVTARLVSGYNGTPALDNHTRLFAAGQLLDDRLWAGHLRISQSGTALNLGGNQVPVTLELRRETDVTTTTVLVDALEVRYARRMRAKNDQLLFRPATGTNTLTVRGFSTAAIQVFDVTDPLRPVAVSATVAQEGAANWRASWTADPGTTGRFLAVAATLSPERVDGVPLPKWTEAMAGAPHLVIAPQAMAVAAAKLVAHRRQTGLDSLLVPLEELYNDFAFGRPDPRAIPRFLALAKARWTVPPAYVCLAGDGHVDYHDHFGQAQTRPNHVPPILDRIYQYTPSSGGTQVALGLDNPLGDTDGDGKPDLIIGRLPAQTPAALARMIDRIVQHEAANHWKNRILMVSDRDSSNIFEQAAGRLAMQVPPNLSVQQINHAYSTTADATRTQIIQGLNSGVALSVYVGHANSTGFSSPYIFEHNASRSYMSALTNLARTSLLLTGACMVNDFAAPQPESRCLGKGFLDTAPGGAVAVFGAASETTLPMSESMIRAILGGLFQTDAARLGDLVRSALDVQLKSVSPWMVRTSVLMGDPGTSIQTSQGMEIPPPTIAITRPAPHSYSPLAFRTALPSTLPTYSVSTNRLDIAGTAFSLKGVAQVVIRNSRRAGESSAAGTTNWSLNQLELGAGTNLLSAIAYDSVGNSATTTLKVICTPALGPQVKVNCGSGEECGEWLPDTGCVAASGGSTASTAAVILNAADAPSAVYQTRRNGKSLDYSLAIPDGTYMVRLHFAELYWARAGYRKFNVSIEGQPMLANFDIWAAAVGKNRAVTRTFDFVEVRGGLQIQAVAKLDSAQINGIEVWQAPPRVIASPAAVSVPEGGSATFGVKLSDAPAGTVTVTIARSSGDEDISVASGSALVFDETNFGTEQRVTLLAREDADSANGAAVIQCTATGFVAGQLAASERDSDVAPVIQKINSGGGAVAGGWVKDTGWTVKAGGGSSTRASIENAGDVPPAVYQARRYGSTVGYTLKIPDGKYTVRLHFAEYSATNAGQHLFNVSIEGQLVLADFDIFAKAGAKARAHVETFQDIEVRGGLQIQGVGTLGSAQFNGIEVWSPRVLVNPSAVSVPEGGSATFGVKLSDAPAGTVTVTVARASGDADITVASGSALVFTPANFGIEQRVTLSAALDDDAANGAAMIRCRALGFVSGQMTATEQDREAPPVIQKINSGGGAVAGGWVKDVGGTVKGGGVGRTRAVIENAGDVPPAVYQTRRYGSTVSYNLKIPDGKYSVRLHFAEWSATAPDQHKFNVSIEGQLVLADFDLFAAAGGMNRALVQTFENVEVRGGLQIQGVGTLGAAQFNGIEVWSPRVLVNPSAVSVPEDGTATFGVKLSDAPAGTVTVTVARASGDADIAVAFGNALVFTPANFGIEQRVTLSASLDDDAANGVAVIRCRAPGYMSGHVSAAEQDREAPPVIQKINSGGGALGGGWGKDAGWTLKGGGVGRTRAVIENAGDVPPAVYQTRRYGSTVSYNLKIPDGKYTVRLHFAEWSATAPDQHKFNVSIEGQLVLADFDLFVAAGGMNRALVQTFENVEVRGGLQIQGVGTLGAAQFNGIEVWSPRVLVNPSAVAVPEGGTATFGVKLSDAPAGTVTVTVARASGDADIAVASGSALVFTPANFGIEQRVTLLAQVDDDAANGQAAIRCRAPGYMSGHVVASEQDPYQKVNCGGGAAAGGWAADAAWTVAAGGSAAGNPTVIGNCGDVAPLVYQARRWGKTLTYNLSIPDGTYTVKLHFAELSASRAGQRKFNVFIEDQLVLANFDIFAAAGGRGQALVQTFEDIEVRGGLQIRGVATVGPAQFNGIEVSPVSSSVKEGRGGTPTKQLAQAARTVPARTPEPASVESAQAAWPLAVSRGSDSDWIAAPSLVDGDTNTLWVGAASAASWSIALDFEESISLASLEILCEGGPWPEMGVMGTDNLLEWYDLDEVSDRPVSCRAIYIFFPGDGSGAVPVIREIQWEGDLP